MLSIRHALVLVKEDVTAYIHSSLQVRKPFLVRKGVYTLVEYEIPYIGGGFEFVVSLATGSDEELNALKREPVFLPPLIFDTHLGPTPLAKVCEVQKMSLAPRPDHPIGTNCRLIPMVGYLCNYADGTVAYWTTLGGRVRLAPNGVAALELLVAQRANELSRP